MRASALSVLLLGLLALEASGARLFNQPNSHLKRSVGRGKRGKDGKLHYKEVDADHYARAAFDPHYGLDDELTAEDLGYESHDIHEATPTVIEHRLKELFPTIDIDHDGAISSEELQRHLYANGMAISRRRADSEFNDTDTNHDEKVTPLEYLSTLLDEGDAKGKAALESHTFPDPLEYGSFMDVSRTAMMLADQDHDGALNRAEFYDFLNPEEGSNIALKLHRLRQDIYEHLHSDNADHSQHVDHEHGHGHGDNQHFHTEHDLELTFDQFYEHFWSQFTVWDGHGEQWSEQKEKDAALRKFVLLDTNSDHRLSAEELLPAFADIHPTESRYARMQAEHMMDMAECKDDRLTMAKMLETPHAFYGVVHDHDEL